MNAASISRNSNDMITDNAGDSDSDTNSDEIPDYYQPITSLDGEESEPNSNGFHTVDQLNGQDHPADVAENGVRRLHLSDSDEERENEDEEEEEEMERRVELESAARRAFEEDESRRHAPLSSENASRVIEAMRGVSFAGLAPDWAGDVPEERWIDQLRRLRQLPSSTA